jgi:ppGpp synthetase/RelA/SpoT-type nucleotidyltranferase
MSTDPRVRELLSHADLLLARASTLRAQLAELLSAEPELKIHSVTVRVKSVESLAGKLGRPDRTYESLWDVTDLLGLRVITYFEDDVDRVGRILEAKWPVDFANSVDKRKRDQASAFGYSSLHYVCALGEPLPAKARCEIQVRTLLEHAWAEIEHDLGYKAEARMPKHVERRLVRLAGLLEMADQEFSRIRDDLQSYARALPDRIAQDSTAVTLDQLSLAQLLDMDETRALDARIAAVMGKELDTEPFFPEYLLRMLALSGIHTVGEARDGLLRHEAQIVSMVTPYFAFAWASFQLELGTMARAPRGYSLFFLAHANVLFAESLGVSKAERLARLYRELDYPNDEKRAQEVASQLVRAFNLRV